MSYVFKVLDKPHPCLENNGNSYWKSYNCRLRRLIFNRIFSLTFHLTFNLILKSVSSIQGIMIRLGLAANIYRPIVTL